MLSISLIVMIINLIITIKGDRHMKKHLVISLIFLFSLTLGAYSDYYRYSGTLDEGGQNGCSTC